MEFFDLVSKRRSIRKFSPDPVQRETLMDMLQAASWAPSACNQQLWQFVVIEDGERKKQLVREGGSSRLVENAPVVIVVCYHRGNITEGYQSSSAAIQNLLLAASDRGLGSLWLNSYGKEEKIREILRIPEDYFINSFVLIGRPAGPPPPPPPRKPLNHIVHFDTFMEKSRPLFSHQPSRWTVNDIADYQQYFCRKTDLGETVDPLGRADMRLIQRIAGSLKGRVVDLFSYDGSFLSVHSSQKVITVDLARETALYTRASSPEAVQQEMVMADGKLPVEDHTVDCVTCFYKLERLPPVFFADLFSEVKRILVPGGKFLLTFRTNWSLYGLFHRMLVILRRDDIRKTAIYSFFGPYTPLSVRTVQKVLSRTGFSVTSRKVYPFPPEFEVIAVLFQQFLSSGGKTFLHGHQKKNILSRVAARITRLQGLRRFPFGSTAVIEAT